MSIKTLCALLKHKRFVSIGRAGLDFYAEPPGTEMHDATLFSAHVGGSAGNIAVALAKLGSQVDIITCFSDDAVGRSVIKKLNDFGVSTAHCRIADGEARNTLAIVETRLENCQSVIYRQGAADLELNVEDIKAFDFAEVSGVILSGTALAIEPSRAAIFCAIKQARAANVPIVIDMDYRSYTWKSAEEAQAVYTDAISQCNIVIGNDVEFGVAAGNYELGLNYATSLIKAAPDVVIFKKGEFGSTTLTKERIFDTGIFPVSALKPTGAGDAFMGGFIAGLAEGMTLDQAVIQGTASAAIVVTRVACSSAMPNHLELATFRQLNTLSSLETKQKYAHSAI
ncbi:MAG: permease [Rhizobiales bacterium]|nr:PfkB family carbohydrate kinase [Hyphomicrobiales bacterium]NRB13193.1 permease [Hyphomicrobiales bacterium]